MTDTEGKETNNRHKIFPLSEEAVAVALKELDEEPANFYPTEMGIIQQTNPELYAAIMARARSSSDEKNAVLIGAIWCHRVIRAQADANGGKLPSISHERMITYLAECVADIERNHITPEDKYYLDMSDKIMQQDLGFKLAVEKISDNKPPEGPIIIGMVDAYRLMKSAELVAALNQWKVAS